MLIKLRERVLLEKPVSSQLVFKLYSVILQNENKVTKNIMKYTRAKNAQSPPVKFRTD
jgi:hypothetical protein